MSQVSRGIECGCVCPSCRVALVAKKGTKKTHHFAHCGRQDCENAVETAIHIAAKNIISKAKSVSIPAAELNFYSGKLPWEISKNTTFHFDRVVCEKKVGDIIPDILAYLGNKRLIIEILVSHEVDKAKEQKINRLGISAIEIDLSKFPKECSLEKLDEFVLSSAPRKWIYNAKLSKINKELEALTQILPTGFHGYLAQWAECPNPPPLPLIQMANVGAASTVIQ